jgi:hypothetical protein
MKHLILLAAAALGFAGAINTANATPDTSNTVEFWSLPSVPAPDQNSGADVHQALPGAATAILAAGGTHFASTAYVEPINYSLGAGGPDVSATISQFFASDLTGTGALPAGCDPTACGGSVATAPSYTSVTLFEFTFSTTGETFSVIHDDGVSLFADGDTTTNLLPGASAPTSSETSGPVTLGAGTYDLWYTAANGTPEVLKTNTVPVPAPPIGRGLPIALAVGGLLFGVRLRDRSYKRHSLGAVG